MKTKHNWSRWIYIGPLVSVGLTTPVGVLLVRKCSLTNEVEFKEVSHPLLQVPLDQYKQFFEALYSNIPTPVEATSPPPPKKKFSTFDITVKGIP